MDVGAHSWIMFVFNGFVLSLVIAVQFVSGITPYPILSISFLMTFLLNSGFVMCYLLNNRRYNHRLYFAVV